MDENESVENLPVQLAVVEILEIFLAIARKTKDPCRGLKVKIRSPKQPETTKQAWFQIEVQCVGTQIWEYDLKTFINGHGFHIARIISKMGTQFEGPFLSILAQHHGKSEQIKAFADGESNISCETSESKRNVKFLTAVLKVYQDFHHMQNECASLHRYLRNLGVLNAKLNMAYFLEIRDIQHRIEYSNSMNSLGINNHRTRMFTDTNLYLEEQLISENQRIVQPKLGFPKIASNIPEMRLSDDRSLSIKTSSVAFLVPPPETNTTCVLNSQCSEMKVVFYGPGFVPLLLPGTSKGIPLCSVVKLDQYGLKIMETVTKESRTTFEESIVPDWHNKLEPMDSDSQLDGSGLEDSAPFCLWIIIVLEDQQKSPKVFSNMELADVIRKKFDYVINKSKHKIRKSVTHALNKIFHNCHVHDEKHELLSGAIYSMSSALTSILRHSTNETFREHCYTNLGVSDTKAFGKKFKSQLWKIAEAKYGVKKGTGPSKEGSITPKRKRLKHEENEETEGECVINSVSLKPDIKYSRESTYPDNEPVLSTQACFVPCITPPIGFSTEPTYPDKAPVSSTQECLVPSIRSKPNIEHSTEPTCPDKAPLSSTQECLVPSITPNPNIGHSTEPTCPNNVPVPSTKHQAMDVSVQNKSHQKPQRNANFLLLVPIEKPQDILNQSQLLHKAQNILKRNHSVADIYISHQKRSPKILTKIATVSHQKRSPKIQNKMATIINSYKPVLPANIASLENFSALNTSPFRSCNISSQGIHESTKNNEMVNSQSCRPLLPKFPLKTVPTMPTLPHSYSEPHHLSSLVENISNDDSSQENTDFQGVNSLHESIRYNIENCTPLKNRFERRDSIQNSTEIFDESKKETSLQESLRYNMENDTPLKKTFERRQSVQNHLHFDNGIIERDQLESTHFYNTQQMNSIDGIRPQQNSEEIIEIAEDVNEETFCSLPLNNYPQILNRCESESQNCQVHDTNIQRTRSGEDYEGSNQNNSSARQLFQQNTSNRGNSCSLTFSLVDDCGRERKPQDSGFQPFDSRHNGRIFQPVNDHHNDSSPRFNFPRNYRNIDPSFNVPSINRELIPNTSHFQEASGSIRKQIENSCRYIETDSSQEDEADLSTWLNQNLRAQSRNDLSCDTNHTNSYTRHPNPYTSHGDMVFTGFNSQSQSGMYSQQLSNQLPENRVIDNIDDWFKSADVDF